MNKRLYWENEDDLAQLVNLLQQGNISICTTDTVLGFLANVSKEAFEGLNRIKGRQEKPYLILIPSKKVAAEFATIQYEKIQKLIDFSWPGPVTLILPAKETLPAFMQSAQGTVALRVPDHQGLQFLMQQMGPLFSTSANLAGEPIPETIDQIDPRILDKVDFIVTDRNNERAGAPSTILDCTDPENIKVIREGAWPISQLSFLK